MPRGATVAMISRRHTMERFTPIRTPTIPLASYPAIPSGLEPTRLSRQPIILDGKPEFPTKFEKTGIAAQTIEPRFDG